MFGYEFNIDYRSVSPLSLAYIGDAVYELYVRSYVMSGQNMPVAKLHKLSCGFVKAQSQSKIIKSILNELTDEEMAVFKRGRNAHSHTAAKNADIIDYRYATGFEALIGYTYLKKDEKRLNELLKLSIRTKESEKEK